MTLTTRMRVVEPTPVMPLFKAAQRLLGAEHARTETIERGPHPRIPNYLIRNPSINNEMCQGYAAWLDVEWGGDGPLDDRHDWCMRDGCPDDCKLPEHCTPDPDDIPPASIEITFDTTYGYRADNGAGCSDLHAWLILELGKWLQARDLTWWWYDEYNGEWHKGFADLETFGNPIKGALEFAVA